MGQITEDFARQMLTHCERKEHPPLTVWEAEQLARAWLEREAMREDAERYRWLRATTKWASSLGERVDVRNNPKLWDAAIDCEIAAAMVASGAVVLPNVRANRPSRAATGDCNERRSRRP